MKLQEIVGQGYRIEGWKIETYRNERRVVVKLSKKMSHEKKFYVAHSPFPDKILMDAEFTEPVLLKSGLNRGV